MLNLFLANSNASTTVVLIITCCFLGVFLLFFAASLYINDILKHKNKNVDKISEVIPLHICYDSTTGVIVSFYENNPSTKTTQTLDQFITQLGCLDKNRLISWIRDTIGKVPDTAPFIRVYIPIGEERRRQQKATGGMMELNGFSNDNKKLFLTFYRLCYLPFDQSKWENQFNAVVKTLSTTIYRGNRTTGLYFLKLSLQDSSEAVSTDNTIAYTLLLDRLHREVIDYRYTKIFELEEDLILIMVSARDSSFNYKEDGMKWYMTTKQIIENNFWDSKIVFSMGAITSLVSNQIRTLIADGKQLALTKQSLSDTEIAFTSYGGDSSEGNIEALYKSSFAKILDGKNLSFQFQPIINPGSSEIFAYTLKTKVRNSYFSDIVELKQYATRNDEGYELFFEYFNGALRSFEPFAREGMNRIFVELEIGELECAAEALRHISVHKDYDVTLIIDESDFESAIGKQHDVVDDLRSIKSEGCSLGIRLGQQNFVLSPQLYKEFDYFILPNLKREVNRKNDDRIQIYYTRLLEKLLRYKEPAIMLGADSSFMVELLVRLGIDYISGNDIMPYNNLPRDIDKRKLIKLNKYAE